MTAANAHSTANTGNTNQAGFPPAPPETHQRAATGGAKSSQAALPLFKLGEIVATPGALSALQRLGLDPMTFLRRHVTGDWSEMPEEDRESNASAAKNNDARILSAYPMGAQAKERLWIITEWDRSVTTLLLPSEY